LFGLFKSKRTPSDQLIYTYIQQVFGIKPKQWDLYKEALRHKSVAKEALLPHNERLEYLGDAVIDIVVAEYLFNTYPNAEEGELTQMKSRLVSRKNLGGLGDTIELAKHVSFIDGKYVNKTTIGGNALESIIGAIYLDLGYKKTQAVIHHLFTKYLDLSAIVKANHDYKSQILIWAQRTKKDLVFVQTAEKDQGHHKRYFFEVRSNNIVLGSGDGNSKKKAEQLAALSALNNLPEEEE